MQEYIDLKYEPKRSDLLCEFYMEPNRIQIEKAANHVAGESSIDTWSNIQTLSPSIRERLMPHIYSINKNIVKIAYPQELFEEGNMPQILSAIAGNIYGMKSIRCLRLMDISFPKKIVDSFKGPRLGIHGIRKLLNVKRRPLVGTIVKPKVGLNPKEHAKVCYEAWVGGLDVVKDDENLTNQGFNPFNERITRTLDMRAKAEHETGERKVYMPNISAETEEMLKRMDFVREAGGEYIMVDILTVGWAALQTVRERSQGQVIHAHRAGHAAVTRNPRHGMTMLTIGKIARLIGVDQLHIGTANVGKMEGAAAEAETIEEEIEEQNIKGNDVVNTLSQNWYKIKPVFAVASGGLHPGSIPLLMQRLGKNIVMQFGGGVHAHKFGTIAGAKAVRQALDAAMKNIPLEKYAEKYRELSYAVQKWGVAK
ncbi:MAG: type III ribulose-bisphosphate carboxylase [Candidatus Woesearchaeota archaeon]